MVTVTCMSIQCRDVLSDNIRSAQIKAAQEALQDMNNRTSRAFMGATVATLGLVGALGTVTLAKDEYHVLGICETAILGGLWVMLMGESERGDPQERARLIAIIENGGNSEPTNKNNILTDNDK